MHRFIHFSWLSSQFVALALGIVAACDPPARLHTYLPVDPNGWSCKDTLHFTLKADSVSTLRTFSLGANFTESQVYKGVWLVLEQRSMNHTPRRDTMYLPLAHENGKWEAQGIITHVTEGVCTAAHTFPMQPTQLLVYHIMPQQEIRGFVAIGVKVE
ncbi:MAG: gliding motility lipoprotein GldH [Bacteroidaceae bacterium]|nr:gliding motility lipoprotein GldH [Bacteroidaceae bacterium]